MPTRSFHPVMAFITTMLMPFGLLSGCVSDPIVDNSATTTPNPIEEVDEGSAAQLDTSESVTELSITGHTLTVDGEPLAGTWVAVDDDPTTQEMVSETTSDETGAFTITFNAEVVDYAVLASYQDEDVMLATWQGFSVYDQDEDFTFELSLSEQLPIVEENSEDGAVPPPGLRCYLAYTPAQCSNHVWYTYSYYASSWGCLSFGGGYEYMEIGCC